MDRRINGLSQLFETVEDKLAQNTENDNLPTASYSRKLFFTGFLLIGLFGAATFFFSDIYIKLLFFILTNLGVAAVEPLKESYFFEVMRKKSDETRFYPIFKTSSDIGHLTGPLIFSTVLLFSDFNIMFLVASIIMIGYGILALFMKEIR